MTGEFDHTGELHITMLGGFSVAYGDQIISDSSPRAQYVWKLFKYLVVNIGKFIPTDTLIDFLWPEKECFNPQKSLQNLVYRLRNVLPGLEDAGEEYIIYSHGTYGFNARARVDIDTRRFEGIVNDLKSGRLTGDTAAAAFREAIELFRGDFLEDSGYDEWALPFVNYYRRLYFWCVANYLDMLESHGLYDEAVQLCERAIAIDALEEEYHARLIQNLIAIGKPSLAISHYEYITNMLQRELGVSPSDKLLSLGRRLRQDRNTVQFDIDSVFDLLKEQQLPTGAFYCDIEVFKQLFRLEVRSAARAGQSVYVAMFTILDQTYNLPENSVLQKAMDALKRSCVFSLRRGDVVSQFSKSQLLLMLPTLTIEDCERVLERISNRFAKEYHGQTVCLMTKIKPIEAKIELEFAI